MAETGELLGLHDPRTVHHVGVIEQIDTEKQTYLLPGKRSGRVATLFDQAPDAFHEKPVLRVHQLRFAGGNIEEARVEMVGLRNKATVFDVGEGAFLRIAVNGSPIPALGRDLFDAVVASCQMLLECFEVRTLREHAFHREDRDRRSFRRHFFPCSSTRWRMFHRGPGARRPMPSKPAFLPVRILGAILGLRLNLPGLVLTLSLLRRRSLERLFGIVFRDGAAVTLHQDRAQVVEISGLEKRCRGY